MGVARVASRSPLTQRGLVGGMACGERILCRFRAVDSISLPSISRAGEVDLAYGSYSSAFVEVYAVAYVLEAVLPS